jgi:tryptophanyl-tRNA synthetase
MHGADDKQPFPTLSKMTLNAAPASVADTDRPQSVKPNEQIVNPFEVVAADEHGVDYDKLIESFGTRKIDQAILDRFENLTGKKPHRFLRRGLFFSQRYVCRVRDRSN